MKFLRFLPLLILFLIVAGVLTLVPHAQATLVDSLTGLTPESASMKLTAWLQFGTMALAGLSAFAAACIAAFFRLKRQVDEQCARHDNDIAAVNAQLPTPVPTIPPPPVAPVAPVGVAPVDTVTPGVKTLALAFLALLALSGCAETKLSLGDAKHPASFRTAADASTLHLRLTPKSATLDVVGLNHSTPTAARGDNITKTGDAAGKVTAAVGAAFFTKGLAHP